MVFKTDKDKIKYFLEINQGLKLIYSQWFILENGNIIGVPIRDSDKNLKVKYFHSFYKSSLIEYFPELINVIIYSKETYEVKRDMKDFEALYVIEGKVMISSINSGSAVIGKVMNEKERNTVFKSMVLINNEMLPILNNPEVSKYEFSDEEVEKLLNYEVIKPEMFNEKYYVMYLTISEFPLLKKFKNLRAYSVKSDDDCFNVIFETYSKKESFFILRKFLKL